MSDYIRIPNAILKLTERCKHEEALVYAIIRSQIKDNSYKASISQEQIAAIINMTERTVSSYVSDLKDSGLLNVAERKQGESGHPYNVYQFNELKKDYFMILHPLLYDNTISAKLKGLLLFIKGSCWKGTNYLCYNGKTTDLATTLKVGRNQINGYLDELEAKGYIRYIGNTLHITNDNFPLFWNQDMDNMTYEIIYNYCIELDSIPPVKDVDGKGKDKALSLIVAKFTNDYDSLRNVLEERCKNLPEHPSLDYFCQVLVNRKPTKKDKTCKHTNNYNLSDITIYI